MTKFNFHIERLCIILAFVLSALLVFWGLLEMYRLGTST